MFFQTIYQVLILKASIAKLCSRYMIINNRLSDRIKQQRFISCIVSFCSGYVSRHLFYITFFGKTMTKLGFFPVEDNCQCSVIRKSIFNSIEVKCICQCIIRTDMQCIFNSHVFSGSFCESEVGNATGDRYYQHPLFCHRYVWCASTGTFVTDCGTTCAQFHSEHAGVSCSACSGCA